MSEQDSIFIHLTEQIGAGAPPPAGWLSIRELPLLIFVGLTGVGKSTTLAELQKGPDPWALLPDRRALTDALILPEVQRWAGLPVTPITDRGERFAYTRRYRERYPGGMVHALTTLWVQAQTPSLTWLFDGLRGANEVSAAAQSLPQARFVVLTAPDAVRVQRLLGRQDAFDQIASATSIPLPGSATAPLPENASASDTARVEIATFADLGVAEASGIFDPDQERSLLALVHSGQISAADLASKLSIVTAERRNYDPDATLAALLAATPTRTLVVDTTQHTPQVAARRIVDLIHSSVSPTG